MLVFLQKAKRPRPAKGKAGGFTKKRIIAISSTLSSLLVALMLLSACGNTNTKLNTGSQTNFTPAPAIIALSNATPGATASPIITPARLDNVPANGQTIRIYSSLPLTGSAAEENQTIINAIKMALDDFGGPDHLVAGYKIDYQSLDDATAQRGQWDATQETANANKAANDPDAMAYIGTYNSDAAKLAIPILNKVKMPMISPANTYPGLTKAVAGVTSADEPQKYYPTSTRNFFRVLASDDLQGPADVTFATSYLKVKSVYLLDDGQGYGKGLTDAFAAQANQVGIKAVGRTSINGLEANYQALANQIKNSQAEMIFFGGIAQQQPGKMLADIRAAGVTVPFMGGDGLTDPAFIKEAGVAGQGAYASFSGLPNDKLPAKGQSFVSRYQAKYGTLGTYTIYGYEAMSVLLSSIAKAGKKDRQTILQTLAATNGFDGALGKWSFDKNGDTTLTTFTIYKIQGDQLQNVQQVNPR
jgi:branched-chain amino acid transport system substrate-binding protein